jgi:hypothetical protein
LQKRILDWESESANMKSGFGDSWLTLDEPVDLSGIKWTCVEEDGSGRMISGILSALTCWDTQISLVFFFLGEGWEKCTER